MGGLALEDLEKLLFVANKIPWWVEKHKDKFNKLVYKSLKQQNRLYEAGMQKMLFGSLPKDLQDQIKKEAMQKAKGGGDSPKKSAPKQDEGGINPDAVLFADGIIPSWIEKYKSEFSSMVYKSLKAQGKLIESNMQKMLFGSLSQDIQEKIEKEVEAAKKTAKKSPVQQGGGASGNTNLEKWLAKISSQLDEIITLLKS
ncbi:MAG: hypothetical protein D6785_00375 [Planctomycetota bacterium]|nr:MAG: hypothetical protein D6785_00375 [Planctomycetota bacterium]